MKKAIGFIILLSSLALLDGTPIHNHHGKYISTRSKSSLQASPEAAYAPLINEEFIADQDEDDSLSETHSVGTEFFQSIHNTPKLVVVVPVSSGNSSVPRYRLVCDLRI